MTAAVEVGTELPGYEVPSVSAEKMKTMAALLSDPTPIHWDVETLQALGMGDRPINQGPLNMGYVMNAVTDWAGGADRLTRLRVRFLGNVLAGHHLRVRGTVTALRESDGVRLADCDVVLEVVGGDPVVSGTATVVLA
ncbi:MaoC family dehydratase [Trujillonella endophytica]|uniref:Acyl dehydratase n=1 Tax=Trujillonella endophytica TaxID=673521 RepID=A0A1H8QJ40_9ACTN|nr:MaoC/PaaZ C-terminal domain-containing protein [Trujillella endophytica]SEO53924.1 Acyl dehydratase [Trujillella endophytica]